MYLKKEYKNILLVILGAAILAFGLYNFNYQNNITEGGVLGLTLLLENLFSISPSVSSLIIDVVLFLVGMKYFGKRFIYFSVLATLSFSFFYGLNELAPPIVPSLSDRMFLATICCGLFVGIGVGLVVRIGAAAGGDDVIALVVEKKTRLNVGQVYMVTDAIVLLLSLTYLGLDEIFWSIFAVIISGKVINFIFYYKNNRNELQNTLA